MSLMSAVHRLVLTAADGPRRLPDVGVPASLWVIAVLGLMIMLVGLTAMAVGRRH